MIGSKTARRMGKGRVEYCCEHQQGCVYNVGDSTGNKTATADRKAINSSRNLLNRGIKELAMASDSADVPDEPAAYFLHAGKRGRRCQTHAER